MALKTPESGKVSWLNDHLLGLILTRIEVKDDRKSCSEVCKQWLRVEGLSHSSVVVLHPHDFLITALARFPNLVKFETWKPMSDTDLEFLAQACPKLETIKMNWRDEYGVDCGVMSERGLRALGNGCPKLTKVCVFGEGRVGASGVAVLLHNAANLKCLCFIDTLKLKDCRNITDRGLGFLASGNTSQTLRKLILVGCHRITDTGIVHLSANMRILEILGLSLGAEQLVTETAGVAISAIQTLKVLKFDGRWDVSSPTRDALLQKCRNSRVFVV